MIELYKVEPAPTGTLVAAEWPEASVDRFTDPSGYRPSSDLVAAVNVSLSLGKPLLLTGEPGTGKTRLASNIAWQLSRYPGLAFGRQVLEFNVRSTSAARDLFYSFDSMRRFADIQTKNLKGVESYLTFNALGIAFLLSLPENLHYGRIPAKFLPGNEKPARSVVLIDEIDKAPRDFPNDLLNEIDNYRFNVPELAASVPVVNSDDPKTRDNGGAMLAVPEIKARAGHRPVIIITSNSEKHLPDAFLRRCVFFHIDFPDQGALTKIVKERFKAPRPILEDLLKPALDFFFDLRECPPTPQKKPGTAEFLEWLDVLNTLLNGKEARDRFLAGEIDPAVASTLTILAKTREDLWRAQGLLVDFGTRRKPSTASQDPQIQTDRAEE